MKFRSDVCFSNSGLDTIDEHTGVIKGVTIARKGIEKGHGVYLDSQFISDVAKLGNDQPMGVKVRFGHPNMCSDALGTYLGRFKNFRIVEDKVFADLHMDEVAKQSPKGDLYSYVFGMARNNSDMFGNSIVFRSGESRFEEEIGENEEIVTKEYVSIVSLNASDLVDTPAATESLFSEDLTAAKATAFLEENPEIEELLFSNPEIVEQFLHRYENYKSKKNKMDKSFSEKVLDVLKGAGINFGAKEEVENTEVVETEVVATEEVETVEEEATVAEEATTEEFSAEESNEAIAQAVEKFEEEREELVKEFNAKETDLNHALAELGEEVKSLKAELEVKETELAAFNVKPTEVEGNEDPSIKGEEKQLSENASVLKDFLKDIKE